MFKKLDGQTYTSPKGSYKLQQLRGSGQFGAVYQSIDLTTNEVIAIKVQTKMPKQERHTIKEIAKYKFKNVVNIRDYFYQEYYFVVMDYSQEGDLFKYQSKYKKFTLERSLEIILDIAAGLRELHSMDFIHRDLKHENIVLINGVFKLCDLGLSKMGLAGTTQIGTPYYMAPELIAPTMPYFTEVDIWALGCIWYELLTGATFFEGTSNESIQRQIIDCTQTWIDERLTTLKIEYVPLLQKMLSKNGLNRPKIEFVIAILKKEKPQKEGIQPEIIQQFSEKLKKVQDSGENGDQQQDKIQKLQQQYGKQLLAQSTKQFQLDFEYQVFTKLSKDELKIATQIIQDQIRVYIDFEREKHEKINKAQQQEILEQKQIISSQANEINQLQTQNLEFQKQILELKEQIAKQHFEQQQINKPSIIELSSSQQQQQQQQQNITEKQEQWIEQTSRQFVPEVCIHLEKILKSNSELNQEKLHSCLTNYYNNSLKILYIK